MARSTYPRSSHRHETIAAAILRRHSQLTGRPVELPIPIEMIIERTYRLTVEYDLVDEPPGLTILGALAPTRRTIVINTAHQDLLDEVVGPERFTLAHELAHWVYDAENPDQMALEFAEAGIELFCYHRKTPGLPDTDRIREINANKLAAALLMPESLIHEADLEGTEQELRAAARRWGVSFQALLIRLDELGLT
jgi:hypothetical protein